MGRGSSGTSRCTGGDHVEANDLGDVLAAETGFKLAGDPDTVRGPDVAFIGRGRLAGPRPAAYAEFAPDLVVEVRSPNDRPGELLAKVAEWLEAGTLIVWTVDLFRRAGHVYRADGSQTLLSADDSLDGEDVVPGFRCPLRELFP